MRKITIAVFIVLVGCVSPSKYGSKLETVPLGFPVDNTRTSSTFGYRTDPITGKKRFHRGLDFPGKYGSNIYAAAPGRVVFSGTRNGFGNVITINHGNGYSDQLRA